MFATQSLTPRVPARFTLPMPQPPGPVRFATPPRAVARPRLPTPPPSRPGPLRKAATRRGPVPPPDATTLPARSASQGRHAPWPGPASQCHHPPGPVRFARPPRAVARSRLPMPPPPPAQSRFATPPRAVARFTLLNATTLPARSASQRRHAPWPGPASQCHHPPGPVRFATPPLGHTEDWIIRTLRTICGSPFA